MSLIVLQKVRKQGIRFWNERTFWHEMISKSLIPTFGSLQYVGLPKVGIKLLEIISCQNVLSFQNLIPCFLTFCSTIKLNPYLRFEFLIFFGGVIILLAY